MILCVLVINSALNFLISIDEATGFLWCSLKRSCFIKKMFKGSLRQRISESLPWKVHLRVTKEAWVLAVTIIIRRWGNVVLARSRHLECIMRAYNSPSLFITPDRMGDSAVVRRLSRKREVAVVQGEKKNNELSKTKSRFHAAPPLLFARQLIRHAVIFTACHDCSSRFPSNSTSWGETDAFATVPNRCWCNERLLRAPSTDILHFDVFALI